MAHYLQGLIVAGWLVIAARGADFSHELHLKLKPDCAACHTKAPASTKLEDNLLPDASACTSCHKSVQIKQPRVLRLKKFDHSFHVKLGNAAPVFKAAILGKTYLGDGASVQLSQLDTKNACAACHHGIEQSKSIRADTKAHFPHMAYCLVCHNKIDAPWSCETCHGVDKTLKPAFHTADYLDSHSRRGEKLGCAVCHGRRFTCLGCH